MRRLEIGPGFERLPGYETLNAVRNQFTDHVGDARFPPFPDATFDEVYSSHCIEHIEWHDIERTIGEWVRILRLAGTLEVHTVNAAPLMRALLEYEETGQTALKPGKWREDLHRHEPYLWAAGRILNYERKGDIPGLWQHRAILTPRYMRQCFERAGLVDLEAVAFPKGSKRHASINMGLKGRKC